MTDKIKLTSDQLAKELEKALLITKIVQFSAQTLPSYDAEMMRCHLREAVYALRSASNFALRIK